MESGDRASYGRRYAGRAQGGLPGAYSTPPTGHGTSGAR